MTCCAPDIRGARDGTKEFISPPRLVAIRFLHLAANSSAGGRGRRRVHHGFPDVYLFIKAPVLKCLSLELAAQNGGGARNLKCDTNPQYSRRLFKQNPQ